MSFYDYLVTVIDSFQKSWEEVSTIPPEEVRLTRDGKELRDYIISFYKRQLKTIVLKTEIKVYTKFLENAQKLPPEAWNKMAQDPNCTFNALLFIPEWNGNVDELEL